VQTRISQLILQGVLAMPPVTPGGADGTLQYNNGGSFGGVSFSVYPNAQGGIDVNEFRALFLHIGSGIRIDQVTVGGEPSIKVMQEGSSSQIRPIVCQPFTRDVGAGTTLGTVVGWSMVYDADGTLLGKSPIYDDIT